MMKRNARQLFHAPIGSARLMDELEARRLMSVSVALDGSTVRVRGDNANQFVEIVDTKIGGDDMTAVSVDADGNGAFTDPGDLNQRVFNGVRAFNIDLKGGNDRVAFVIGSYDGAPNKTIHADLGNGNDRFSILLGQGDFIQNTRLAVDVRGGGGNDTVSAAFVGNIFNNSRVGIDVDTAAGNDNVAFGFGGDVRGSVLQADADLGSGDDAFTGDFDYEGFDVVAAGSRLGLNARGGSGNDRLDLTHIFLIPTVPATIQGLLDINLSGEGGNDSINGDLANLGLEGGTVRLRESGGAGADRVAADLSADPRSTAGTLDVSLFGDRGNDVLALKLSDFSGGKVTFGPRGGFALVDSGPGRDRCDVTGNAPVRVLHCES